MTARLLVVVTGVPGAGKTTLATALATALEAPYISLDAIKEDLHRTAAAPRDRQELRLCAEKQLAVALTGMDRIAVVDIWIAPGRDTDRIDQMLLRTGKTIVEVLCRVAADVAVERYARRERAGPHLPADEPTLQRIREAVGDIQPMGIGHCVEVDTSETVDVGRLVEQALGRTGPASR